MRSLLVLALSKLLNEAAARELGRAVLLADGEMFAVV
jgi:hypothetical protein